MTTTDNAAGAPAVDGGAEIKLGADTAPLQAALASLEAVFKTSPEICQHFLGGLNTFVELCRVDGEGGAAAGAGDIRVIFQPSDRLRDFLLAARAGDLQLDAAGI